MREPKATTCCGLGLLKRVGRFTSEKDVAYQIEGVGMSNSGYAIATAGSEAVEEKLRRAGMQPLLKGEKVVLYGTEVEGQRPLDDDDDWEDED